MTAPHAAIGGILPVLYSFFDDGGGLRLDGYAHQIDHAMASGAHGVVLFGFVTQFYRLTLAEKLDVIALAARQLAGRGTLGITVMEPTIEGQRALVTAAEDAGADWIIVQPPLGPPCLPQDWVVLVEALARATPLTVALQNAPLTGTTLTAAALAELNRAAPNIAAVKAETDSADVAAFATAHGDTFRVITGNWGVDYPFFRAHGVHGLIPAPNFVAEQVEIHDATERGDLGRADAVHAKILPLMQFIRERGGVEAQLILGKYAYERRTGYPAGGNRLPGPPRIDPLLRAHIDRLTDTLAA